MRKKLNIALLAFIVGTSGTGIGLGLYFWLNPLGGANEALETGTVLLNGTLVEIDDSHYGRGTVQIVSFSNGYRQLQFIDVKIANGPDLFVYLSDKESFSGIYDTPGAFIDLRYLPHNAGNFSISISNGISLSNVNSVLIWCRQFSVVFTYATLI
ncbi:MAG: DM13 domain-containing protein [Candidatus Thorarchaeota archaeon]